MKRYTHLIWDFNGTLYNDVTESIESANDLLAAHGLPTVQSVEDYRALFGFPIVDYYRRMGFDFEKTPYSELAVEWVAYYLERSKKSLLYPDALPSLARVKAAGIAQIILSATQREMLREQVASLGILSYFDDLLGLENIHAHSKEEIGKAWRAKHPKARPLLIGDTEHDAEVATAMEADCILVCCGHRPKAALQACKPLLVADSVTEALDHIL
ncbi:MAG: HAD family hydrolase [Clostridia bacterium]|nr:HAD family hydrolase [Clostridia bacterium]